jgi:imidazolonepropionase-like amidohydrolase
MFVLPIAGFCNDIYVFRNVNVIPMDKKQILKGRTVVVHNGRIVSISLTSKKVPTSAKVVDARGMYMMPGLMDMHVHFFYEQGITKDHLPTEAGWMLANGVTTARVMNGDTVYKNFRDAIAARQYSGPELFVVSPQFVGAWPFKGLFLGAIVATPEEARAAVRQFKAEGYDEIKITFYIKRQVYDAIVDEAKKNNIKVTGHIGHEVKLPTALRARQQIEHYDEFLEILLPDSSINKGITVSGPSIWNGKAWQSVEKLDEARIPLLVKMVKDAGISVTPTSHFLHSSFGTGEEESKIRSGRSFKFIPDTLIAERFQTRNVYWSSPPPEAARKKFIDLRNKITVALHKAGVPLMAGSDSPEWFLVQGFSIHDELEAFVKAGLTPYDAIQTATVNTARYLGINERKGMIREGMEADFILLEKNPLENIQNTRTIGGVFTKGEYIDTEKLKTFLVK